MFKRHWKEVTGGAVDLRQVTEEVAKALEVSHDIWMSPTRIWVRVGKAEAEMRNWDAPMRAFVWLAALTCVPLAFWVEELRPATAGLGLCITAFVIAGLGVISRAQLDSGFESRVKVQLDLRAKAKAVEMPELAVEAIVALWAIQNRPWLSTLRKMYVNPLALDNNINQGVADPIRRALALIAETKPKDYDSWIKRNYYDQLISGAETRAETFRSAWFRTVWLPTWVCRFVCGASGSIGVLVFVYPYVAALLRNMS